MCAEDRYASFDYSSLIQWDQRLPREWKFLEPVLAAAPSKRVLDLGSGTGEHARFLASKGLEVTGIDFSPAMVEKARAGGGTFIQGDMREVAHLAGGTRFGAALCLGNALPHLTAEDDVARLARGLADVLLPGAPVIVQLLNYDRIEAKNERSLPVAILPGGIVFLRMMEMREGRRVIFMPTILRMTPDAEPPMELVASQRVEVRGWRAAELQEAFRSAGFASADVFGSYAREPFEPSESRDVILVAVR